MLGIIFIAVGVFAFFFGAISASVWANQDSEKVPVGLFFTKVIGPLLGGAILAIFGLKEFF